MYLHFYGKEGAKVNTWNDYRNDNPEGGGNIRSFVVEYNTIVPEPATITLLAPTLPAWALRRGCR